MPTADSPEDSQQQLSSLVQRILEEQDSPQETALILQEFAQTSTSILSLSQLADGQDPLAILSPARNPLASLYILYSRVANRDSSTGTTNKLGLFVQVNDFLTRVDGPALLQNLDLVYKLGDALLLMAREMNKPLLSIKPLSLLLDRVHPSRASFSRLHPMYLMACLFAKANRHALGLIQLSITEYAPKTFHFTIDDYIWYRYCAGMVYVGLKRFPEACKQFTLAIKTPGKGLTMVQTWAWFRLALSSYLCSDDWERRMRKTMLLHDTFIAQHLFKVDPEDLKLFNFAKSLQRGSVTEIMRTFRVFCSGSMHHEYMGQCQQVLEKVRILDVARLSGIYSTCPYSRVAEAFGTPSLSSAETEQLLRYLVHRQRVPMKIVHGEGGVEEDMVHLDEKEHREQEGGREGSVEMGEEMMRLIQKTDRLTSLRRQVLSKALHEKEGVKSSQA